MFISKEHKERVEKEFAKLNSRVEDLLFDIDYLKDENKKLKKEVDILEFQRDNPSGFKKVESVLGLPRFPRIYTIPYTCEETKLEYIYKNEIRYKKLPFDYWELTEDGKIKANGKLYTFDKETEILTEVCDTRKDEAKIAKKLLEHSTVTVTHPTEWHTLDEVTPKKRKATKRNRLSAMDKYYDSLNLNEKILGYKPIKFGHNVLKEKEVVALLKLFTEFKYVEPIAMLLGLEVSTIRKYAFELAKANYLVFDGNMGRVNDKAVLARRK